VTDLPCQSLSAIRLLCDPGGRSAGRGGTNGLRSERGPPSSMALIVSRPEDKGVKVGRGVEFPAVEFSESHPPSLQ